MTDNSAFDLSISRLIKAPRHAIWRAWSDPARFAKWWIPAPLACRVVAMDLRAGGAFTTQMSEDGQTFTPHLDACFLAVEPEARIVFTNALSGGWRPTVAHYPAPMTAEITFTEHAEGTTYAAHVMHGSQADRDLHAELGFEEGWGTVIGQLAEMVERG